MVRRKFTLALFLLGAPAVWAQFGNADMMKLAASRWDTITKALKLTPEQVNAIKPLLESKYTEMGSVKQQVLVDGQSGTSKPVGDARNVKREAIESLKAISSRYDKQITSLLKPDQAKQYKSMAKGWKDDLSLNSPKP